MGRQRVLAAAGAVAAMSWLSVAPAGADLTTPPGHCEGSATFSDGTVLDSTKLSPGDEVTVPLSDKVAWTGRVIGVPDGSRPVSGDITLDLLWPFQSVTIASWSGTATTTSADGTKSYDLPSFTPRNVSLELQGHHDENGQRWCTGTLEVKVEGSALDSPITFASLGLTAVSAVGLVAVGRAKYRRIV